ncbi:hypothetical protein M8C21_015849 [Ambrosia artemisiifolia]|uniref:DUF7751 domain-containing protein n=1 Tax=Ambrosia artemisiifolia TaxID=4212 RepID=A0AAD5D1R4_AMBAR|nr:hypothetical protein M8C21_015849 [Ambrosia artemisiifolia]
MFKQTGNYGSTSWKPQLYKESEIVAPWCRLITQTSLNQSMTVCTRNFLVGSNRNSNIVIKEISAVLCCIRLNECEGSSAAVLESKGSKGYVHVIKKGASCILRSGDEVVFSSFGNHAYIFQQLSNDVVLKYCVKQTSDVLFKRRARDPSAVAGASILASLSNLRPDISRLKKPAAAQAAPKTNIETPNLDGLEVNLLLKKEILAAIVDGHKVGVSFDEFPYYLSENTKNVLIAASYIHLKHRDQVKYASELPTVNPRILLSGPANSEIYQETLAKALAYYYGAKLLIFDSNLFLGGLSSKAELLKEGSTSNPSESNVVGSENNPSSFPPDSQNKMDVDYVSPAVGPSKSATFKLGDRVKFIGGGPSSSSLRGPTSGARGRVLLLFEDNPLSKIGVKFDKPVFDGVDLGVLCEGGFGYFCFANELRLDSTGVQDLDKLLISTFESRNIPFILFMKDAEKSIVGNSELYSTFRDWLETLPDNVVVIGSQTHTDNRKEKSHPGGLLFTKFGSHQTALLDFNLPQQLDKDAETLKMKGNLNHLRNVLNRTGLECDGLETLCIKDQLLTNESSEKVVGWALSHHLMQHTDTDPDARLVLSTERYLK